MKLHYIADYLLNPTHRITVNLIGCGGTGSQVLSLLARLNEALLGLGHPGLMVTVYDADIVSEANVGRQLYSPADIGHSKAVISVTRVNRFFGYDWRAMPNEYTAGSVRNNGLLGHANITISCVDSVKARVQISKQQKFTKSGEPHTWQYYWLDFGNLHHTGQVVLGTVGGIKQPDELSAEWLPNVIDVFPKVKKMRTKNTGPSCSLAQALGKQDLFINSTLANLGVHLLWKLFRECRISYHGIYLNLDTMTTNPIKIK